MTRKIILIDVNNIAGPQFYNISAWVDTTRLSHQEESFGVVPDWSIWVIGEVNGNLFPVVPEIGWEIIDYDQDFYGSHVHKYYNSGVIMYPTITPTASSKWTEIVINGFQRQMAMPIQNISFSEADFPTEGSRVLELINQGQDNYGLRGNWDAVSNVQTGSITYKPDSITPYNNTNLYDILEEMKVDVGQTTDPGYPCPSRFWFVRGVWIDSANPETQGIQRVLYYFSSRLLPLNPVPLTDNPYGLAYYNYDTFTRSNSSTSMGTAETGQDWAPLVGTWGISSNQAYLVTASGSNNAVVLEGGTSDCDVQTTISSLQLNARLIFRVVSQPAQAWKWEGLWISENATDYVLQKYEAGVINTLHTYSVSPANGDVLKVVLSGSTITLWINNIAQTPVTSTFNQTAHLYGLAISSAGVGRFDNFSVYGVGASYTDLVFPEDGTGIVNILPIQGPNSDPTPVSWNTTVHTDGANDGDLTKNLDDNPWEASTTYFTGDIVTSTNMNGGFFKIEGAGGSSGGTEPTWNNTEGVTTTESTGLVWTRRNWNAGGTSYDSTDPTKQLISEDGGYVQAQIEEIPKVSDSFNRDNNSASMGKTQSEQEWNILGPEGTIWGILNNRAYPVAGSAPHYAYVDSKVSTCIIQVTFLKGTGSNTNGCRLLFRARDEDNLLYLEANTTVGQYRIFRRQGGSDSQIATHVVAPANGDVIKLSLEGSLIKFYLNGTFATSITDTFNQGSTLHGIGTGFSLQIQFDDFSIWQTDETMAFGLGPTTSITSYSQIAFGWVSTATRHIQPVESGTLVSNQITYSKGDTFKVAIRPVQQGSNIVYLVQYYYNGSLVYNSTQHPTPTSTAPFYVQGAIYDKGATISNTTIKRFTYGIYQDDASVDKYGPIPANKNLVREDLDTQAKRIAYKEAFFSRHAEPQTPVSLTTLQEYQSGTRVILNNGRIGWVNKVIVVPTVKKDWSSHLNTAFYSLVLSHSEREWGDDEPAGFLTQTALNVRSEPDPPSFFSSSQGLQDGERTVSENFSWVVAEGIRFVEIQLRKVGGNPETPVRFSADPHSGAIHYLPPGTSYTARARTIDYNNNTSTFGPFIEFTTIGIGVPNPPVITSITSGLEGGGLAPPAQTYYVEVTMDKSSSNDESLGGGRISLFWIGHGYYLRDIPGDAEYPVKVRIGGFHVGDEFIARGFVINHWGWHSLWSDWYPDPTTPYVIPEAAPSAPTITNPITYHHTLQGYVATPIISSGGGNVDGGGYIFWIAITDGAPGVIEHVQRIPENSDFPFTGWCAIDENVTYRFTAIVLNSHGVPSDVSSYVDVRIGGPVPVKRPPITGFQAGGQDQVLAGWLPSLGSNSDFAIVPDSSTAPGVNIATVLRANVPAASPLPGVRSINSLPISCNAGETIPLIWSAKASVASQITARLFIQPQSWGGDLTVAPSNVGSLIQVGANQLLGTNYPSSPYIGTVTIPSGANQYVIQYKADNADASSHYAYFAHPFDAPGVDQNKFDIESSPLRFFDAGITNYRGQLNYSSGSDMLTLLSANPTSSTDLTIGTGTGSNRIIFQDSANGGIVFQDASVVLRKTVLGTSDTDGFVYLGSCAGRPTGTPTSWTGVIPLVWDSTNNIFWAYYSSDWHPIGAHSLPITSSGSWTNSASESGALYTFSVPANFLHVGTMVKVHLYGTIVNGASGHTNTIRFKMGGNTIFTSNVATVSGITGTPWEAEFIVTCRSTGSSGTIWRTLVATFNHINADQAPTATTTINTTVAEDFTITAQFNAASSSDVFTVDQAVTEIF